MRTTTRKTLTAASTLALALAACSPGSTDSSVTEPADREATVAPEDVEGGTETDDGDAAEVATGDDGDASTEAVQTDAVEIDDFAYDPPHIEVAPGTTVTFSNEDATAHTVTAGSEDDPKPDEFDERVDEKGQTIEWTFDEPGTYAYYCELHPFMEGTVTVTG